MLNKLNEMYNDFKYKMKYSSINKNTSVMKEQLDLMVDRMSDILSEKRYLKEKKEVDDRIYTIKIEKLNKEEKYLEKQIKKQKELYLSSYDEKLEVALDKYNKENNEE